MRCTLLDWLRRVWLDDLIFFLISLWRTGAPLARSCWPLFSFLFVLRMLGLRHCSVIMTRYTPL